LRTRGLGVRYLTRRALALRDVTFAVGPGERVLLAGASGSGKSTLALCLAGLIPNSVDADVTGSVEVDGTATVGYPPGDLAERVGVVFQDPTSEFTMLTVEDEVAFGLENLGVPAVDMPARVAAALASAGLSERARWRIDRLSGGQQQRVALAAALAMQPGVLVLDEPTAHLDPRSATRLYDVVHAATESTGATLVVVEHDVDRVVPAHVERGLLLDRQGRLITDAGVEQIFGSSESARHWEADGVRLPTATALVLALDDSAGSATLPFGVEEGGRWVADRPWAQQIARAAAPASSSGSQGEVVIRARSVWHRYVAPSTSSLALRDVDLAVSEGELLAIVGSNGSGKTTLLRTLTGLLVPERGEVIVGGVNLRHATGRQIAGLVSHVFQNPEAGFVADSVQAELEYGPRALGWSPADIEKHARGFLEQFGLTALARANPFTLSEGQKRRLSVATSLVLGPRALLLDEPTFGQDRQSAQALVDEIAALRAQGLAIVVATHDLSLVAETADRVVALSDAQVVFDGPPSALIADAALLEAIGQEPPVLDQIMRAARARGADVPTSVRWHNLLAARTAFTARQTVV